MNASRVMEVIWLILGTFCLVIGIYATYKVGFSQSYMFFVLTLLAIVMYFLRRNRRTGTNSPAS